MTPCRPLERMEALPRYGRRAPCGRGGSLLSFAVVRSGVALGSRHRRRDQPSAADAHRRRSAATGPDRGRRARPRQRPAPARPRPSRLRWPDRSGDGQPGTGSRRERLLSPSAAPSPQPTPPRGHTGRPPGRTRPAEGRVLRDARHRLHRERHPYAARCPARGSPYATIWELNECSMSRSADRLRSSGEGPRAARPTTPGDHDAEVSAAQAPCAGACTSSTATCPPPPRHTPRPPAAPRTSPSATTWSAGPPALGPAEL
jgi:hypothetical protein